MKAFRKKELPKVEPVKIKPLFGMKPGLWLTIAYFIAILLLVFLIAFLPDIIDGHKRVTFTSDAGTAAVYLDGVYQGGTPFTRSIKSGTYQVSYQVNGCEIDSFTIKVGHPVFLNWLFPRTQKVSSSAVLTADAYEALTKEFLTDLNAYSAVLDYDDTHRYPQLITEYYKSVNASGIRPDNDVTIAATLFTTTDVMNEDFKEAASIIGVDLLPIYSTLDGKSTVGTADTETPTVSAKATSLKTEWFTLEGYQISDADFSNGNTVTASYPDVIQAGKDVHTDAFNIGTYCITESQYSAFMAQNPQWAKSNKDIIVAQGLVDEYYLEGVDFSSATVNRPVHNISWYAAQAFCSWLSDVTGKTVSLPSENQWIAASLTDTEGGFQKSLMPSAAEGSPAAMLGGVWEMTSTKFIPLARISADVQVEGVDAVLDRYGIETDMVVKGGSYVNDKSEVDRYTVGITTRSFCSSYMGFRVVWN